MNPNVSRIFENGYSTFLGLLLTINGLFVSEATLAQSGKPDIKITSVNCQNAVLCEQSHCAVTVQNADDSISVQNIKFAVAQNTFNLPVTNCLVLSSFPAANLAGPLGPGQTATVQVPFTSSAAGNVQITFTAFVSPPASSGGLVIGGGADLSYDANPEDNVMSAVVNVAPPPPCDVEVQSLNCGSQPVGGQPTNCDIILKNNGPGKARGVTVRIEPPAAPSPSSSELVFVATNSTTLNQFAAGQTQHVSIPVTFQEAGEIPVSVNATVSDIGGITDSNPANNSVSATVTVGLPNPIISAIEPSSDKAQAKATIKGRWFAKFGSSEVPNAKFGTTPAVISKVATRELVVAVPCLEQPGLVPVSVTTSAGTSNNVSFKYAVLPLAIQQLSSTTLSAGQPLKILLANVNPRCPFSVKLGNQSLTITDQSKESGGYKLLVNIPARVLPGPAVLYVENAGGKAKKEVMLQ